MISVRRYNNDDFTVWNNFIANAKNATFQFHRDYMDYHADRFDDYSLIVYFKNEIIALLPANKSGNKEISSHSGLTYGGIILAKEIKLNLYLQILYTLMDFLHNNDIDEIIIKALPDFYSILPSQEYNYGLFLVNAEKFRVDTSLTIIQNSRLKYQTRRIRSIKKAAKGQFEVKQDNDFESFWKKILEPNLMKRFGKKPVHSLDEILLLRSRFPNNIYQVNIYENNQIVGGTTMFITSNVAHAQYISANDYGRSSGGLDLLFDILINQQFSDKKYFNFGICNENQGKRINHGLLDWKEGFVGRTYVHEFYRIKCKMKDEILKVIKKNH